MNTPESENKASWSKEQMFIDQKIRETEVSLRAREDMEKCWRGGTDASWRAAGCKKSKAERLKDADTHSRIAAKIRGELEMFKSVSSLLQAVVTLNSELDQLLGEIWAGQRSSDEDERSATERVRDLILARAQLQVVKEENERLKTIIRENDRIKTLFHTNACDQRENTDDCICGLSAVFPPPAQSPENPDEKEV